jgi:hypothetical protein
MKQHPANVMFADSKSFQFMRGTPIPAKDRREASFPSRQRELQSLHRQFHSALQSIAKAAPLTPQSLGLRDHPEEEQDAELFFSVSPSNISPQQETRLLIREIQQLEDEVRVVEAKLTERCSGPRKAKVAAMVEQITELHHVLERQLARAEDLLR